MGVPIGERIRSARQQLGLSQRQLAGREMTRSLISLVEAGRCNLSDRNLAIIAQRLGQPPSYFATGTPAVTDAYEVAAALLESAERNLHPSDGAAHEAERALHKLQQAMEFTRAVNSPELELRIRCKLVLALRLQNRYEETIEACERAIDCCYRVRQRPDLPWLWKELGRAAFLSGDFVQAQRAYEQAVLHGAELKTAQAVTADALMGLGTTFFRLGQYDLALASYFEAMESGCILNNLELEGNIARGMGWTYFKKGDLNQALQWTRQALQKLTRARSADRFLARQNLAIISMHLGHWEAAYTALKECLTAYQSMGEVRMQAVVIEDLAQYYILRRNLNQAERYCNLGLDLLDAQDDGVQRARYYRQMGQIAAARSNQTLARSFLRMSVDLFRGMKVADEAEASRQLLEALPRDREDSRLSGGMRA